MQFSVSIVGNHSEGPDAKARFDKIVEAFTEKLNVNGFIATDCYSTHDERPFVGEASPTPPELLEDFTETAPFDITPPADSAEPPSQPTTITSASGTQAAVLAVEFASNAAAELADHNNLTNTDFEGVEPSGDTGFTTFDVREVIKARN